MRVKQSKLANQIFQIHAMLLLILFLKTTFVGAQNEVNVDKTDEMHTIFSQILMQKSDKLVIEMDIKELMAEKKRGSEYLESKLTMGKDVAWSIKVKPRGKFRRKICEFPPLKIKFSKKELLAAGLDTTHNKMKLVTHCVDNSGADLLLAKEFAAYKMYEKLTPFGFRARLVEVVYQDFEDKKRKIKRLGMLLEDDDEMAERLGGRLEEPYNMPADSLNGQQNALLALFEYMIGNTDWGIETLRNVRLVRPKNGGKLVPVPYDFDFSGLVSAPYASPSTESHLKTVRERFWMGEKINTEQVKRTAKLFKNKRREIEYECTNADNVTPEYRAEMERFIGEFYEKLEEMHDLPVNKPTVADR